MMDPRPEGVYCSWIVDPEIIILPGYFRRLQIERVNGDGSISTFSCTNEEAEAGVILRFLVRSLLEGE